MEEQPNDFLVPREAIEKLKDNELLRQYIEEGRSFQEILGYSDEVMQKYYEVASSLMHQHRYKEATDAFVFLTTLNPYCPEYWLGMGMCEQINQEYQQAIVAYSMVILSEHYQPLAYYHTAACHHALGDDAAAIKVLNKSISFSEGEPHYLEIYQQACRSKDILEAKIENKGSGDWDEI